MVASEGALVAPAQPLSPVFREGRVELAIDLRAYRLVAIQKAGYRLAARCTLVVETVTGDTASVRLVFPASTSEAAAMEVTRLYFQELLDQELREQLRQEMGPLRQLIVAYAYSRTGLPSDDVT